MDKQSDFQLRPMQMLDLPQVNLILSRAFTQSRIENGLKDTYVPPCRLDFLKLYLNACPQGCFVIEATGSVVAFVFSRLWGSVGWMGPLAVLPEYQGQGLGKRVVSASSEFLQNGGAKTIGLETNYKNLGFYSKLGFEPSCLCLDVIREISLQKKSRQRKSLEVLSHKRIPEAEKLHIQKQLKSLIDNIAPGLDYSGEIALNEKFNFGDTLIAVRGSQIVGFAICHTQSYTEGEPGDVLKVNILALDPAVPLDFLREFILEIENYGRKMNFLRLGLRVPTRFWRGYKAVLSLGFKITHSDFRFTLEGFPERDHPDVIHFSRWE